MLEKFKALYKGEQLPLSSNSDAYAKLINVKMDELYATGVKHGQALAYKTIKEMVLDEELSLPLKTAGGWLSLGMLKFFLENRCKDLSDDTPVLFYDDQRNLVKLDSVPHKVDVRKQDGEYIRSHSKVYDDTFKAVVLTK